MRYDKIGDFVEKVYHELDPVFDAKSKVLILGSLPSPKSREVKFYYAHKQNRFWPILETIFDISLDSVEDKVNFLLDYHIALWDVVASCIIEGASDQSIHEVVCNDIAGLLSKTEIHTIFSTGKKAYTLYQKYIYPQTGIPCIYLPSTSPANCATSFIVLKKEYYKIKEALENTI